MRDGEDKHRHVSLRGLECSTVKILVSSTHLEPDARPRFAASFAFEGPFVAAWRADRPKRVSLGEASSGIERADAPHRTRRLGIFRGSLLLRLSGRHLQKLLLRLFRPHQRGPRHRLDAVDGMRVSQSSLVTAWGAVCGHRSRLFQSSSRAALLFASALLTSSINGATA